MLEKLLRGEERDNGEMGEFKLMGDVAAGDKVLGQKWVHRSCPGWPSEQGQLLLL